MTTVELYVKGAKVWIPNAEKVWEGAELREDYSPSRPALEVVSESNNKTVLKIRNEDDLPFLRNPPILIGENDLTSLSYLHEPAVLHNLQVRFCQQKDIYTYCGIVLVAINPYSDLPIYGSDTIRSYRGQAMGDLDPHIFAVAEEAYTSLEREHTDQSIIVSGESGAGKTVSAKYAMRYFATVGGSATETQIEKKVLASSPVMEAIGNAKTTRNDNSSRFGKFIELQLSKQFHISGASMRTYLLEKSRVVFQAPEERNYHIFYQLCAAREEYPNLELDIASSFHYLRQGQSSNTMDDMGSYKETVTALTMLGFSKKEQNELFKIVAGILHLGNINFVETLIQQENEQDQEGSKISNTHSTVRIFADLLEIDIEDLILSLCTKKMVSLQEVFMIPMTTAQAKAARDALAKHIYAQLFEWVVAVINKALESDVPKYKFIGVLDIYGFETFEINSFEQFCINYANEKLQQQFNLHVFKLEQEEYIKEEIEWKMIDFYDNQPCIDLIEAKLGVLDLLDEECRMPKGSDRSWTEKLYSKCIKYSHFGKARFGTSAFVIDHFSSKVQYESNGFLEKNRDTVIKEQILVLKNSKNTLVRKLFCGDNSKLGIPGATKLKIVSSRSVPKSQKTQKTTVGAQFRDSLNMLMATLNATTPHYVRCIKPNDTKTSFEYNPHRAVQQLRACGVLETIRISAAGFPSRWSYHDFFYRYRALCKFIDIKRDNMRLTCSNILKQYIKNDDHYQFGKTKIFFRAGQVAYLEKLRSDKLTKCCIIMQSTIRAYICRKKYLRMTCAVYNIQRYARGYLARRHADSLRRNRAAITIQRYARGWIQRIKYQRIKSAVEGIQTYARGYLARIHYKEMLDNAKAITIQRYVRGWLARQWYQKQLKQIILCQSAIRRFLARRQYRKLKIEAKSIEHVKSLNKGLENKIISLQQKFDEVNKQNNELKKKEVELIDLRHKLTTFKALEVEVKNLHNVLGQKDINIEKLEVIIKNERDEKMDIIMEHDKYKQDSDEQRNMWNEEMSKLRKELENINEIVKNHEEGKEQNMKERIEHEKLLILNEQDHDIHAYQKLLQEYHDLEQHCEEMEHQLTNQNKHERTNSDASSVAASIMTTSDLPDDHGYGSVKSTTSSLQHGKLDSIDWQNVANNTTESIQSTTPPTESGMKEEGDEKIDIGLLLKLQNKLSEVEREKERLQKRLDHLDTSPRTERADNAVRDSQRISELELYISTLKAHFYELQDSIEEGSGREKLQDQNKTLHDELERRSEEIVQLKSILAEQTNNMKSLVGSRTRTGEYINEDGELALAYETQKTINKQLELELQDEMTKYKAHEKEYKLEIDKLREDNERQQRLLADNLHVTPESKTKAYMQHEITRLTKENLVLQDKTDVSEDTIRKHKKHIKILLRKLEDSGVDVETLNDLNKQEEIVQKHGRALPNIRKKERDHLGMFSFKSGDESNIMRQLVIDLKPRTAVTLLPGLPGYVVFKCIRHTDFINDEDKVKALLSNYTNCVKKVVKKRHEDFETVTLWLSNTLRLVHCMKQYSGDIAFQRSNTKKQNEQCLRNFDLSEYRQVLSDIAVWIYQVVIRDLEEKVQPLIVPAILEHEEIRSVTGGNKPAGFSRRASISAKEIGSPGGNQKPTSQLLTELTNHHKILTFYGIDPEVISQIFKQIFYFICASSLNNLLLRKELCHWSKGFQIRHNLSHFEMWTRQKNLDEQAIHTTLEPIIQASHLLQARKTDEDVTSVCEMCSVLTSLQICKILNLYTPVDEFEQRVPPSFIRKVQAKLEERSSNQEQQSLLMDIQYTYPVRFPFNPSVVCLEDIEIPEAIKLHMLEKV